MAAAEVLPVLAAALKLTRVTWGQVRALGGDVPALVQLPRRRRGLPPSMATLLPLAMLLPFTATVLLSFTDAVRLPLKALLLCHVRTEC